MTMGLASTLLVTLWAQQAPESAGTAKSAAQSLLDQGTRLYEGGRFEAALEMFKQAYATYPADKLWFDIAQAERNLGRPVEALQDYERFLSQAGDASAEVKATAEEFAAELRRNLGQLRIEGGPAGATVSIDHAPAGVLPLRGLIWVAPGRHEVGVDGTAKPLAAVPVTALAGTVQTVVLRPPENAAISTVAAGPAASVAAPVAPGSGWLGRRWTWVAAGSAVLFSAGAVASGLLMQQKFDALDRSCGSASANRPGCTQDDIRALDGWKTAANALWIATGVAAITTGVLFFVEGKRVRVAATAGKPPGLLARVEY